MHHHRVVHARHRLQASRRTALSKFLIYTASNNVAIPSQNKLALSKLVTTNAHFVLGVLLAALVIVAVLVLEEIPLPRSTFIISLSRSVS